MLTSLGPGVLGGITFGQWCRLLRQEGFAIHPACLPRAISITTQSLKNSIVYSLEQHRYGPLLRDVVIQPPIFVLGHWRNGTTHLHQLLAQDRRFAFPNGYQVSFPHTFLTAEKLDTRWMSSLLPKRRPMDNMEWSLSSPQEDELALCSSCLKSPCTGWVFSRRKDFYARYLTFRNATAEETAEWSAAFKLFMKKLTWKYRRPLVLKSPQHTARVRLLLELFPGAKFVHIHRDPYAVFQSTRNMVRRMSRWHALQRWDLENLESHILEQGREMYEAFLEDRSLIPAGCFHEIAFEALEKNPREEMQRLYDTLHLPDFRETEADLERYLTSIRGYQKNQFPSLPPHTKAAVHSMWRRNFEEWNYAK